MIHPEPKKRATIRELRDHPWTNEGYADRPPSFHPNYPPVPLDNSIVKRMIQMGYTSKEVQAVVLNNETSPILTTYHAIRNLSMELVPDFHLHDASMSLPLPQSLNARSNSLPQPPAKTPAPARSNATPARPINVRVSATHSVSPESSVSPEGTVSPESTVSPEGTVSPESPRLDALATPPLLAIAAELPDQEEQLSSSPIISTFDELLSTPFKFANAGKSQSEYRAVPQETDYFGTTPPLPHCYSLPSKRIVTPPPSPASDSPVPSPSFPRPRGNSDPSGNAPASHEFELDMGEEAQPHSLSTPSSPQRETMVYPDDPDDLSSSPPAPEKKRTRARSAGDVKFTKEWPVEISQEQIQQEDAWTIFQTLEDENSRGFHRQAISSPSISLHHTSAPILVPKNPHNHNSHPHGPNSPASPDTPSPPRSLPEQDTLRDSGSAAPAKTGKLSKLFSRLFRS
eukprot:Phypoly_transcript_02301.p1 GENE.Phypoly_transcript_02301~~Phypoly_transcript_02301.p1  ORF type:complete len:457 (+),score=132.42 Phypoly_transcript_02301:1292-2662(+)